MRLIDVSQENIKSVLEDYPYYPDEIWKFSAMTERFTTIAAVEVVRCKDCKYWKEHDGEMFCNCWGNLMTDTAQDDFCSYGERRKNE